MSPDPRDSAPVAMVEAVVIDCVDVERVSRFWQGLLGGELRAGQDVTELHGGRIQLDFAPVPEGKQVPKNRLHLDLYVPPERKDQAVAAALRLGATRADDIYDGDLWHVMRDPEGNEFCFVWHADHA